MFYKNLLENLLLFILIILLFILITKKIFIVYRSGTREIIKEFVLRQIIKIYI